MTAVDTTPLNSFSEIQLLEALRAKSRARRDELKGKIMDLRQQLTTAEAELANIADDDAKALSLVRGQSPSGQPGRKPGMLATAILAELRAGPRSPSQLVQTCGEYINSVSNKGAIMSQKLAAMRKQGKVQNPDKGVWTLPDAKATE